jgi:hypothetical protein
MDAATIHYVEEAVIEGSRLDVSWLKSQNMQVNFLVKAMFYEENISEILVSSM